MRDQRRNVVVCAQKSMGRNHNNPDFWRSHGREEMHSMLHILNTHGRFLCHVHVSQCCSCLYGSDVDFHVIEILECGLENGSLPFQFVEVILRKEIVTFCEFGMSLLHVTFPVGCCVRASEVRGR